MTTFEWARGAQRAGGGNGRPLVGIERIELVCHGVPQIPNHAGSNGRRRLRSERADHDLLSISVIGGHA